MCDRVINRLEISVIFLVPFGFCNELRSPYLVVVGLNVLIVVCGDIKSDTG